MGYEVPRTVKYGFIAIVKEALNSISGLLKKNTDFHYEDYDIGTREYEIITLVAEGLSNREIAEHLYLSEGTVRNYLSSILDKLQLRDRTQLAVFYFERR